MARKRVKKASVTGSSAASSSGTSRATQLTISRYHELLKRRRQHVAAGKDCADIDKDIEAIGGIDAYQRASQSGQSSERGGDSARVLMPWLQERGCARGEKPISCVEIGAVRPDNLAVSWIDNQPIDLNSQHPEIREQNFMDRPASQQVDLISCSLVLNYVDDPTDRGRMLRHIHATLFPRPTSLLFLVLPLPCVRNSRYLDRKRLLGIMAAVGFELVKERWKEGGRVGYWLWTWCRAPGGEFKKELVNDGPGRNNFAIVL